MPFQHIPLSTREKIYKKALHKLNVFPSLLPAGVDPDSVCLNILEAPPSTQIRRKDPCVLDWLRLAAEKMTREDQSEVTFKVFPCNE